MQTNLGAKNAEWPKLIRSTNLAPDVGPSVYRKGNSTLFEGIILRGRLNPSIQGMKDLN